MKNGLVVLVAMALFSAGFARAEEDVKPGLVGEYYDMGAAVEDFPVIPADKKPTVKRVDKQVNVESVDENFSGTNLSQHFFVRWTGLIKIEKAGKYKFILESDDGSRLYINGVRAIDNSGMHAMEKKDGEAELPVGTYPIKLDYFQNEGGAGCKLYWSADGGAEEVIPEKALWHKTDTEK